MLKATDFDGNGRQRAATPARELSHVIADQSLWYAAWAEYAHKQSRAGDFAGGYR